MIEVTDQPIDPAALLRRFSLGRSATGAIVSFTGLARGGDAAFPISDVVLEAYPGMTEATIAAIVDDARGRFEVQDILVVHRAGAVPVGQPIVFVAAAAAHRRAAFEATDFVMDHLKTRAAFWKKEVGSAGSRWVEPRTSDHADQHRWTPETT
jgi:molybdopterin synthase catalytic subunit